MNNIKSYNGWTEGDLAMRKGRFCTIVKIDFKMDPPSVTVKMNDTGDEVGTEFEYLSKPTEQSVSNETQTNQNSNLSNEKKNNDENNESKNGYESKIESDSSEDSSDESETENENENEYYPNLGTRKSVDLENSGKDYNSNLNSKRVNNNRRKYLDAVYDPRLINRVMNDGYPYDRKYRPSPRLQRQRQRQQRRPMPRRTRSSMRPPHFGFGPSLWSVFDDPFF